MKILNLIEITESQVIIEPFLFWLLFTIASAFIYLIIWAWGSGKIDKYDPEKSVRVQGLFLKYCWWVGGPVRSYPRPEKRVLKTIEESRIQKLMRIQRIKDGWTFLKIALYSIILIVITYLAVKAEILL